MTHIQRALLSILSLAIAGVLAYELTAERKTAHARTEILQARSDLPRERIAPVLGDLRSAQDARPGTEAGLLITGVEFRAGREEAALAAARAAARREPDNFAAQSALARLAPPGSPEAKQAARRARELNPLADDGS